MKHAIVIAQHFNIGLSYMSEILNCKIEPTTLISVEQTEAIANHIYPFV